MNLDLEALIAADVLQGPYKPPHPVQRRLRDRVRDLANPLLLTAAILLVLAAAVELINAWKGPQL